MYSNRRGLELRSDRRSCNASPGLYAYCPPNEGPYPSSHSPFLRGHPDFGRYDAGYLQPHPNYLDHRPIGFLDRSSQRLSPYVGMDAMTAMPSGMLPVQTVPTSITVPQSKQSIHRTENGQDPFLPFGGRPNYGHGQGVTVRDALPTNYDSAMQPPVQQSAIQIACVWIMMHCSKCRLDVCPLGDRCARLKTLYRHIMNCTADNQCTRDKCYEVKHTLQHFERCQILHCKACQNLRELMLRFEERLKYNDAGDIYGSNPFGRGQPVRRGPYRMNLGDGTMFGDSVHHTEYSVDQDAESGFYGSTVAQNPFLVEGQMPFGLEGQYPSFVPQPMKIPDIHFKLGTSLFETFSPYEIESSLKSIRDSNVSPTRPDQQLRDKVCAVCLLGEQTFQAIQLYCDCCSTKIKRGRMYWKTVPEAKIQCCACHKCFNLRKDGIVSVGQMHFQQQAFRFCKNDDRVTETWVECDKCGYWVHASCGLFNRGENNDDAKYMCPFCLKEEMESGNRRRPESKPISMWGAQELSICPLSDFIQTQVNIQLHHELKKITTSVSCPPLTIRVLMSVEKTTKVQSAMAESFPELPKQYPYRQKVIGVFQKIHGVDVLIFCMYVQEYDTNCKKPNQKWVNLEYIDSVKHFTPDVRTSSGESLRSVVYQESLLAYIQFVKRCGYEVFYIWACPPAKEGEDYILHCKPKSQRIPTDDRLKAWYKKLLKTAKDRSIVTHDSNLMDTFFSCGIDRAAGRPFSAEEMPYFEGDYWPGQAEKILKAVDGSKLAECCRKPGEKRKTRGEMSVNEALENGLMVSLPFPRWSDFMVWHLQEPCSLCPKYITRGYKYVYHFESNGKTKISDPARKRAHFEGIKLGRPGGAQSNTQFFQICEACYRICAQIGEGRPTPDVVKFADLVQEEVTPIASVYGPSKEEDSKFSKIFESRQAFLAFCKGNHYQFDTLQHAKHSTMMLLYHLHNTAAPMFPVMCQGCGIEILPSSRRGSQMDICQTCKMKGIVAMMPDRTMMSSGRNSGYFQRMEKSFNHAAYCNASSCTIPGCFKMKELFAHYWSCKMSGSNQCSRCYFFSVLAERHAHFCTGVCNVPDCDRVKAIAKQQMRLDQAQRSRVYNGEASGSSSSS